MTLPFSSAQLRAARALLNWSRVELAKHTGISEPTLHRLENDIGEPEVKTHQKIRKTLEQIGIEFLDNSGVRFRPEGVEVLNGKEGMEKFWNRVFAYAQTFGGIIRQNGISEGPLDECAPEAAAAHRDRMGPLVNKRKDIFVRALIDEGDTNFLCNYVNYRWKPKGFPPAVPYYIFGDSVGIFAFEADPSPKVVLITSPIIAQTYITQYDKVWGLSKIPAQFRNQQGR